MTRIKKNNVNIGKAISYFRNHPNKDFDNKLSQMELAIKLGVSRQTISNWETNASRMDTDKLTQLCSILGVSYREILDYASKPDIINVENERLED